jgi:hypothetical protein
MPCTDGDNLATGVLLLFLQHFLSFMCCFASGVELREDPT